MSTSGASDQALDLFTKQMSALFEQKETEDNWNKFEDSLIRFTALTKSSSHSPIFVGLVRSRLKNAIIQSLITERTRLARTALNLVSTLATSLGEKFDSLSDIILPTVLKLTTRANKVYVSSATATMKTCIEAAGLPSLIPLLVDSLKTPSKSLRLASMDCVVLIANRNSGDKLVAWIGLIEKTIADGVVDSTPEVRDMARRLFELYKNHYPNAVAKFQYGLSDMAKKYLKVPLTAAPAPSLSRRSSKVGLPKDSGVARRKSLAPMVNSVKSDQIKPAVSAVAAEGESGSNIASVASSIKRPSSIVVGDASSTDTPRAIVTGAQRVARQPANPIKPRLKAAQRVPSSTVPAVSATLIHDGGLKSIATLEQSIHSNMSAPDENTLITADSAFAPPPQVPQIIKSTKSKMASLKSVPPKKDVVTVQLEKAASLSRLAQDIHSSDWAVRLVVFESLETFFSNNLDRDFNTPHSDKCLKLMIDGLGDAHFRVVLAALGSILYFVDAPNFPIVKLESLLPRLCLVAFYPLQKSKHGIIEKAKLVVDRILSRVPPLILGQAIVNSLGSPVASGKTRVALLGFANSLSISSLTLCFSKQNVCKAFAGRLVPFVLDQDVNILAMVKSVVLNMWHIYPDYMAQGFAHIHSTERAILLELTGKDFLMSKPGTPVYIGDDTATIIHNDIESVIVKDATSPVSIDTKVKSIDVSDSTKSDLKASSVTNSIKKEVPFMNSPILANPSMESKASLAAFTETPSKLPITRDESLDILETVTLGDETPKSSKKADGSSLKVSERSGRKSADSPSRKKLAPSTPTKNSSIDSSTLSPSVNSKLSRPGASSTPPAAVDPEECSVKENNSVDGDVEEIQEKLSVGVVKSIPVNPAPRARRTSMDAKSNVTPVKSFLPKKSSTSFVSKIAVPEFRSPARVMSSVTPSITKILDSQVTPKASLIKSVSKRTNPTKFMTQLKAVSPDNMSKSGVPAQSESLAESSICADSPIPENISVGAIEKAEATTFSPSSNSSSIPESEATVSTEQPHSKKLSIAPSIEPMSPASHSRIPSATRARSPSSLKDSRVDSPHSTANSKISLSIDNALRQLQSSKSAPIKSRLLSLSKSLQSFESPLDQATITNILIGLFKFEEGHVSVKNEDLSYELQLSKRELETRSEPIILLQSIIATMQQGVGLKPGFEYASKLVKRADELNECRQAWEDDLVRMVIQAMGNSSQSGVRKAAHDLAFALLSLRPTEWKEEFYANVRQSVGAQRERVLQRMFASRTQ